MFGFNNIKIISGGQTGADRAALDFALKNRMPCGGWCPKGRIAEDGEIAAKYPLKETDSKDYPIRTSKNIEESDGTLIFYLNKFDPGTGLTLSLCKKLGKPYRLVKFTKEPSVVSIREWIVTNNIQTMNVAGPRESSEPGIYSHVKAFLKLIFEL
jgi:hypothetical protein